MSSFRTIVSPRLGRRRLQYGLSDANKSGLRTTDKFRLEIFYPATRQILANKTGGVVVDAIPIS
jgi:hypothetical protein